MLNPVRSFKQIAVVASLVVTGTCVTSSLGQTFYEPVRYQYGDRCNVYYYGGTDPRVHVSAGAPAWARANGFAFSSASMDVHREVCTEPTRVFSDALPYRNAATYGATASDAANEANAAVPTYFRKRDLLAAGQIQPDGTIVVPARAPALLPGQIRMLPTTQGRHVAPFIKEPLPMLIIPKTPAPAAPSATAARL